LNELEQAQWEAMAEAPDEGDRLARSREAMIIDGEERHLLGLDEEGIPVERTVVQTTTLVTTEHRVPSEEKQEVEQAPEEQEEAPQREPSQGSGG
jgi:hypothetical protein